jgi:uncharacterized protein YaaW (UPF0174 family)
MYFADAWVAKRATKTSSTKARAFEAMAARDMLGRGLTDVAEKRKGIEKVDD